MNLTITAGSPCVVSRDGALSREILIDNVSAVLEVDRVVVAVAGHAHETADEGLILELKRIAQTGRWVVRRSLDIPTRGSPTS